MEIRSIQESEQIQRNPVSPSSFYVIHGKKTVGDVLDLLKGFLVSTHLKKVFLSYEEVSLFGIVDRADV